MNVTEIADKLEYYNEWRRGADTEMPDTKELGIAIEEAVKVLREVEAKIKEDEEVARNILKGGVYCELF